MRGYAAALVFAARRKLETFAVTRVIDDAVGGR
jgi:hypothetical protein